MIMDTSVTLSDSQAITSSAASTNIIDLGAAGWWGAAGASHPIPLMLQVNEAFTASGSATLTIAIRSTTAADTSTNLKTHYVSDAIGKAALTTTANLNDLFRAFIPTNTQRYLHLYYTVATGPMTAGKITAKVVAAPVPNNK